MPVAMAKMFGSKMMSSAGKPTTCPVSSFIGALADLGLAREGVGLAGLVEGHDDDGGAVAARQLACSMNFASPSFIEIELTMPLPWMHLRPASITSHFDESRS